MRRNDKGVDTGDDRLEPEEGVGMDSKHMGTMRCNDNNHIIVHCKDNKVEDIRRDMAPNSSDTKTKCLSSGSLCSYEHSEFLDCQVG